MDVEARKTDAKARLVLPKACANTTVIIEQVSETELHVRLAKVIAEGELALVEESVTHLSNRDRDRFLAMIENPPAPTSALKKAASRHRGRSRRG